jgi:hypothetical protein
VSDAFDLRAREGHGGGKANEKNSAKSYMLPC